MKTSAPGDVLLALLAFDLSTPNEAQNDAAHFDEKSASSHRMMDLRDLRRHYAGGLQPV